MTLAAWQPRPRPPRSILQGRYCRLEPLDRGHFEALYAASTAPGAEARFRYLFEPVPDRVNFVAWFDRALASDDPLYFAVIDLSTQRCEGRQALMRITPEHGVIEIGSILWGPAISRTRVASEALFLTARHVFDTLGYRRLEWKCNERNEASMHAARRFGFSYEGTFRQHMVIKGDSRDTAWFAICDGDWPRLQAEFERWLSPDNFDTQGRQRSPLCMFPDQPAGFARAG